MVICEKEGGLGGVVSYFVFQKIHWMGKSQRCEETEGFVWTAWGSAKEVNCFISLSLHTVREHVVRIFYTVHNQVFGKGGC